MAKFIMLCRGGQVSDKDRGAHMQKWGAWMGGLAQSGKLAGGEPLQGGGKIIADGGAKVENPPPGEDAVNGYILVKVENLDEALGVARSCPLLEIGGRLEIRETIDMSAGPPRG